MQDDAVFESGGGQPFVVPRADACRVLCKLHGSEFKRGKFQLPLAAVAIDQASFKGSHEPNFLHLEQDPRHIDERRDLELRAGVVNVLNHPIFGNPNVDINSANFGQISSAENGRRFTLSARINF